MGGVIGNLYYFKYFNRINKIKGMRKDFSGGVDSPTLTDLCCWAILGLGTS